MSPPRELRIIAFDIETSPLPVDDIKRVAGEFNEDSVKVGNLGLEKAMEKIATAKKNHIDSIIDKGALNAEFGKVVAIGIKSELEEYLLFGEEEEILPKFWSMALDDWCNGDAWWVGFNSNGFDLPFLLKRSLIAGVQIPKELLPVTRYWNQKFWKDLLEIWQGGDFKKSISLDRMCKAFGIEGKNGSGKYFYKLLIEDPDRAEEYLLNDIRITYKLATKIINCIK
jgi:predicted PolB exonuclease-like 3'-5' exonuclease